LSFEFWIVLNLTHCWVIKFICSVKLPIFVKWTRKKKKKTSPAAKNRLKNSWNRKERKVSRFYDRFVEINKSPRSIKWFSEGIARIWQHVRSKKSFRSDHMVQQKSWNLVNSQRCCTWHNFGSSQWSFSWALVIAFENYSQQAPIDFEWSLREKKLFLRLNNSFKSEET
jgi:hypothetical protein